MGVGRLMKKRKKKSHGDGEVKEADIYNLLLSLPRS